MNKATAFGLSTMTALWLTLSGCASNADTRPEGADMSSEATEATLFLRADPDALSLTDEGCHSDLVETLVNRDVYEKIAAGDSFAGVVDEDNPEAETTISQRIQMYKEEREEKLSMFFDCSDQNAELHGLANDIVANPLDGESPDKFRNLMVTIASERMDDVYALYPLDMIQEAAQEWKDIVLEVNDNVIGDVKGMIKDDVLETRINKLIEDNYDQLALSVARLEMSDYLGVEGQVEGPNQEQFTSIFQKMITTETAKYIGELKRMQKDAGPIYEI